MMPIERCTEKGRRGYKWGEHGNKCYVYESGNEKSRKAAYEKAARQGRAIKRMQSMGGTMKSGMVKKIFGAVHADGGGIAIDHGIQPEPSRSMERRDMAAQYGVIYSPWGGASDPSYWHGRGLPDWKVCYDAIASLPEISKYFAYYGEPGYTYWRTIKSDLFTKVIEPVLDYAKEKRYTWEEVVKMAREKAVEYMHARPLGDPDLGLAPFSEQVMKEKVGGGTMKRKIEAAVEEGSGGPTPGEGLSGKNKSIICRKTQEEIRHSWEKYEALAKQTMFAFIERLEKEMPAWEWVKNYADDPDEPEYTIERTVNEYIDMMCGEFYTELQQALVHGVANPEAYAQQCLEEALRDSREYPVEHYTFADQPGVESPSQSMKNKVGGGTMKRLPLRSILTAAASFGDLLSLLRKVKDPTKEVTAATKALEGMVAKYDGKATDAPDAALKAILANLKKVPKPTEENPRTRVLKTIKLLEELLAGPVKASILQASILQIARILKAVEEPTTEVAEAIKLADKLAKSEEEGAPAEYGKIVSSEGMTKLLKMLEAVEEKPDAVTKAIAVLKKLLGGEEKPQAQPDQRGELPSYGVSKLEAGTGPGIYRARLIRAGEALDGTTWPEKELKSALDRRLFEGVPVNAISYSGEYGPDIEYHLPEDTTLAGQVVGNQIGFVKDCTWDEAEKAVYGVVYITEDNRRNLVDSLLTQGLDAPGMSIYADGMKDDGGLVTNISGVHSMDLVTFPAADGAILSQALTAAVKNWGMMKRKVQAAVEEGTGGPAPGEGQETAGSTPGKIEWGPRRDEALSNPEHDADVYELRFLTGKAQPYLWATARKMRISDEQIKASNILESLDDLIIGQYKGRGVPMSWYADPSITNEQLWQQVRAWIDAQLEKLCDGFGKQKVGGGMMDQTALEKRLDSVEKISRGLNERVVQADVDGMIDQKLQASKLPASVQSALRTQLTGKQLDEKEVQSFIGFQQDICDKLAVTVEANAGVTLEGGLLPGKDGEDTLEGAVKALFDSQIE